MIGVCLSSILIFELFGVIPFFCAFIYRLFCLSDYHRWEYGYRISTADFQRVLFVF